MKFRLRQIEVFRAVMMTGSMTAAARMLNVSQPAISRIIDHTEQRLGLNLFDRGSGRLEPTPEARTLIIEVEKLWDQARQVDDLATQLSRRPEGALIVAASPSLSLHFIPAVIAAYIARYPKVQLRYHTALITEMSQELTAGRANLAISVLPIDDPNVICKPLASGRMVCLIPENHALADTKKISLEQLAETPLVMYDRHTPSGHAISNAFERRGISPKVAVEVPHGVLVIAMVREGIGPAFVDEFAVAGRETPGIVVRPLVDDIATTISISRARFGFPVSQSARNFINLLHSYVE